jgi:hypothetical protein
MSLNNDVTALVVASKHPMTKEITALRRLILSAHTGLTETVKWNSPNFALGAEDRITLRIQPIKHIQIIFHHGSKPRRLKTKPIKDAGGILDWKGTERAVLEIRNAAELKGHTQAIVTFVKEWIDATA